jgi:Cytochrome P460
MRARTSFQRADHSFHASTDSIFSAPGSRSPAKSGLASQADKLFAQLYGGGLFIQAPGQVIELPSYVLVGQGEELAYGLGTNRIHGLEQPFHHAAEHLSRFQVRRRPGQTWVAPVQHVSAQPFQPVNGTLQQLSDNRLGGRISGKRVQVALHNSGGAFFTHDIGLPEFHAVYMDPESFAHYEKTGEFRDGTVMVKELIGVGAKKATSGKGYFMGDFSGLETSIKDSKRFKGEPGRCLTRSMTSA